jgi:hypothetical protein
MGFATKAFTANTMWYGKQQESQMSKHDTATKRHRRPKSGKRLDYTARTMAALKQLTQDAKASESQRPLPKNL